MLIRMSWACIMNTVLLRTHCGSRRIRRGEKATMVKRRWGYVAFEENNRVIFQPSVQCLGGKWSREKQVTVRIHWMKFCRAEEPGQIYNCYRSAKAALGMWRLTCLAPTVALIANQLGDACSFIGRGHVAEQGGRRMKPGRYTPIGSG